MVSGDYNMPMKIYLEIKYSRSVVMIVYINLGVIKILLWCILILFSLRLIFSGCRSLTGQFISYNLACYNHFNVNICHFVDAVGDSKNY